MKKILFISALFTILLSAIFTSSYNAVAGKIHPPEVEQDQNVGAYENEKSISVIKPEADEKNNNEVLAIDNELNESLSPNDLPDTIVEEPTELKDTIIGTVKKTNQNSQYQINQQRGKFNEGGNQYRYKGNNNNSQLNNGMNGQGFGINEP
jgi:hypothetical protein